MGWGHSGPCAPDCTCDNSPRGILTSGYAPPPAPPRSAEPRPVAPCGERKPDPTTGDRDIIAPGCRLQKGHDGLHDNDSYVWKRVERPDTAGECGCYGYLARYGEVERKFPVLHDPPDLHARLAVVEEVRDQLSNALSVTAHNLAARDAEIAALTAQTYRLGDSWAKEQIKAMDFDAKLADAERERDDWKRACVESNAEKLARLASRDAEVAALKKDQSDWRKGVALIASALGERDPKDLSCVRFADACLELGSRLAEIEKAAGDLCCTHCGVILTWSIAPCDYCRPVRAALEKGKEA
jgi:hypothetical protein